MPSNLPIGLDEFLALPETKPPTEFIDGEAIQKPFRSPGHALLVPQIVGPLWQLEQAGHAFSGVHLDHLDRPNQFLYVPDISVFRAEREKDVMTAGNVRPLEQPPDLAIDIVEPVTPFGSVVERALAIVRAGASLVWLIDIDARSCTVFRPGQLPIQVRSPGRVSAAPVFPGFELDLGELFGFLVRFRANRG